jgi:asparagine synthase (glutamine-hydrolysing)
MCGLAGILKFKENELNPDLIRVMTDCMSHRGPDATDNFIEGKVGLGHKRLSIIDLSEKANQPFIDNSGRFVLVYNGEVYNFREVKSLIKNYTFKTSSDTEVLIAAFNQMGIDCVHYLKGMFAFAVWDRAKQELFLVRDRLGVKPLYYYCNQEHIIFASECRAILATNLVPRRLSKDGLNEFLSFQSVSCPLTMIQDIRQLEPGSYLKIKNGIIEQKYYWDITEVWSGSFDFLDIKSIENKLRQLLEKSVERRLVGDVKMGIFLSGGIDSSAIVGLISEVINAQSNTFNISFGEKEYDESAFAEEVARKFNTNHSTINIKPVDFLSEIDNALSAMDLPTGDGVNTYVVSKIVRTAGITVALSGLGGDELFAGYPIFKNYLKINRNYALFNKSAGLRKLLGYFSEHKLSSRRQRIFQILKMPSSSIDNIYPILRQILSPEMLARLTNFDQPKTTIISELLRVKKQSIDKFPLLSQVSIAEYLGYTGNTLIRDIDQMSMAVSLEVRAPFLDHDLVEFALGIPDKIKFSSFPKGLLVNSIKPLLPESVARRKKQGFLFPWNEWMKKDLRLLVQEKIYRMAERDFIRKDALLKYWDNFLSKNSSVRWSEIWLFFVLETWLEKNNVNE